MSYILYINGLECELPSGMSIAQTKQVNDIANITNRNANFTQSIKLRRTANNTRVLQNVGLVGNGSNLPYIRNVTDLIDADTGEHLIYKGWAVLTETTDKEYILTVYDGSIDFYRAIENITITQCGISDLNHIKSLANIIETWTDLDIPYRYILADYNGNNIFEDRINVDYQVPSASVPYIWNRIFDFIGYEYSGSIFNHEDFQNLWLTFPKPTGELEPNRILIEEQPSENEYFVINYVSSGNVSGSYTTINADVWRENFVDVNAQNTTTGLVTTTSPPVSTIPVQSYVEILIDGTYSLDFDGADGLFFKCIIRNALNEIVSINDFQGGFIFNALVGYRVTCLVIPDPALGINTQWVVAGGGVPIGLDFIGVAPPDMDLITVKFSRIDGYAVNFDEIFIDFKVSDFIKEIVIRFGLTPFKDKYTNKVKFLTLYELLQNPNIVDYSNKYIDKVGEKYSFGNYAKRNNFKYKYNDDGFKHNDGFIEIENENINEEITIIQSLIYSPEGKKSNFLGGSNVYKIWEKEIKDDNTVEYKDLENRFYFQRAEKITGTVLLISELTNDTADSGFYYRESYFRLNYQSIVYDWYRPINSIFNKSKLVTANFWLKPFEVSLFDFSKLIYIEQLSSYYLVNKIVNFVKGKPTKLELIEVDYFSEPDNGIIIVDPSTLVITDDEVVDCELILTVETNLPQPFSVDVLVYNIDFNSPLLSNLTDPIILDGSCFTGTPIVGTEITITNVIALSVNGFERRLRIFFESDFTGTWNYTIFVSNFGVTYQLTTFSETADGFVDIDVQHPTSGGTSNCSITAQNGVQSNIYQYITT